MSELKPCPFCGPEMFVTRLSDNLADTAECPNCGLEQDIQIWQERPIEDALRAELEELREVNRWISVDERLPEDSRDVLITDGVSYWDTRVAHYKDLAEAWYYEHNGREVYEVTHWRPLPAPPEAADD